MTGPESLLSSLRMTCLPVWTILFITLAGEVGLEAFKTGARRQLEHVLASCVKGNGRGVGKLNLISQYKCAASALTVAGSRPLPREQERSKKTAAAPFRGPHSCLAN